MGHSKALCVAETSPVVEFSITFMAYLWFCHDPGPGHAHNQGQTCKVQHFKNCSLKYKKYEKIDIN